VITLANPQKENGFVAIANELIEVLSRIKLNGTQFRIILAILRATYGYNRKYHHISDGFLSKVTGINQRQINREIQRLIKMDIIKLYDTGSYTQARVIGIQKDYSKWKTEINDYSSDKSDSTDKIDSTDKLVEEHLTNQSVGVLSNQSDIKNIYKNKYKDNIKIYPEGSIEMSLTLELVYMMKQNNPNVRTPKNLNKWAAEIDKMIRLDGRTPEDIRRVIYFSQKDPFWQCNILSTKKLREKFDQLYLKCKNAKVQYINSDEFESFRQVLEKVRSENK